jgi:hypothetical protein
MIGVKVTTQCGHTWPTSINAALEGARSYFMGQRFTVLNLDESESELGPVVSVELIPEEGTTLCVP